MISAERFRPAVTVAAVIERDGRYLLVEEHTPEGLRLNNPAGHLDPGETPEQGVSRECLEETGYRCKLIGLLPQRYQGTTGTTVFFVGVPEGAQQPFGPETEETRWVSLQEACELVSLTKNHVGRERDHSVVCDLSRWLCARQQH